MGGSGKGCFIPVLDDARDSPGAEANIDESYLKKINQR